MDKECAPAQTPGRVSSGVSTDFLSETALRRAPAPSTGRDFAPSRTGAKDRTALACVGPFGSFSWFAARDFVRDVADGPQSLLPVPNLESIFRLIDDGLCSSALIPLENSLTGGAGPAIDLFLRHDLRISAEYYARADTCLLSREPNIDAIRVIYSHSRHLARCAERLTVLFPDAAIIVTASETEAVHLAAQMDGTAALGHRGLAAIHGFSVLSDGIQNSADITRFVRVERRDDAAAPLPPCTPGNAISSLIFTLPDSPDALASVFQCLAEAGVSIRKLETRPLSPDLSSGSLRNAFFADIEADLSSPANTRTMHMLRAVCSECRLLGCYPRAAEA